MTPKCNTCPVVGECDCPAVLCRRHEANPRRWRKVVEQVNGSEPLRPSLAEFNTNLAAIKACPHFSRPEGCGCAFGRCGKYDRATTYRECLDCGEYRQVED